MSEPDVSETIMPWGKYKGKKFSEIPQNYFEWCLTIELRPWIRKAITEYLSVGPLQRAINKEKQQ